MSWHGTDTRGPDRHLELFSNVSDGQPLRIVLFTFTKDSVKMVLKYKVKMSFGRELISKLFLR